MGDKGEGVGSKKGSSGTSSTSCPQCGETFKSISSVRSKLILLEIIQTHFKILLRCSNLFNKSVQMPHIYCILYV